MGRIYLILFLFASLVSCSHFTFSKKQKTNQRSVWTLNDAGINYALDVHEGYKNNRYIRKEAIKDETGKLVERRKIIATKGAIEKKGLVVLRPDYSFLEVWIDKVTYGTVLKLNDKTKSFDVTIQNREGVRSLSVPFPKRDGLYCFHTGLVECLRITGFLDKAKQLQNGMANLNIVWEGAYIYHKLYEYYPVELFTSATFEYSGKNEKGLLRFNLNFKDQTIFYLFDDDLNFKAMYWVSQALSIEAIDHTAKKTTKVKK